MKNHPIFKRALISFMGLVIVLNCTSQTPKEKRVERDELRKSEKARNFETLGSLINSRSFVFMTSETESRQISDLSQNHEYETSEIKINGSLVKVTGLKSSEWWKSTSCTIVKWELTENPEELTYSISFIARSGDTNTAILIKILSDKTAIAQFGGREFRGQIRPI